MLSRNFDVDMLSEVIFINFINELGDQLPAAIHAKSGQQKTEITEGRYAPHSFQGNSPV